MIMFGVVMLIILGLAYVWVIRGFLSSLLHMICVVVAGAVAFGMWETVTYFVMGQTDNAALVGSAWAIGLIIPFVVVTLLLRVGLDSIIRNNAQAAGPLDYAGAGVCGLITGTITAGILVIGIGTTRVGSDFLGHRPVDYASGSLQRTGGLLIPVDRLVGAFYGHTSEAAFSTAEPLAKWYPDPSHMSAALRLSDGGGKARNTAEPGDFEVVGSYILGVGEGMNGADLLKDSWNPTTHNAATLEGEAYSSLGRQKMLGVWINPKPQMKEKSGDIIFGEGQVWLVAETASGERIIRHPVAVVSPAQPASEGRYGRWRFDAQVFVALPGAAILPMAFEFILPLDAQPLGIFVKGLRGELSNLSPREYQSTRERDAGITSGGILPTGAVTGPPLDASLTQRIGEDRPGQRNDEAVREAGVVVSAALPLSITLQKGSEGPMELGENNRIIRGEHKIEASRSGVRGAPRNLLINQFATRRGTSLVQIDVSMTKPASLLGQAVAAAERVLPPVVVDDKGTQYRAIGWVYKDRDMIHIRYTPDRPIAGLAELQSSGVSLSRSRPDQALVLLFEVTDGVKIESFGIGGKEVFGFATPIEVVPSRR